jgi:hypothetical protein
MMKSPVPDLAFFFSGVVVALSAVKFEPSACIHLENSARGPNWHHERRWFNS